MKNIISFTTALVALLVVVPQATAQGQLEDKLKSAPKRYPEADTNNDGVLSMAEARAFRAKMRGKKNAATTGSQPIDSVKREQPDNFQNGASCLFLGHSFFIPVAKRFDEIAAATGLSQHKASFVMNGGDGGAPGRIWSSKAHRTAATQILETGNVHLLGMTYYDETNCRVEDYERWIDLAIKHNPKVRIFIGLCWPDAPQASMDEFDNMIKLSGDRLFRTVQTLRKRHPATPIQFVHYGHVARELKASHAAGHSSEIAALISREPGGLFRDTKGHAGELLLDVAALTWLEHLYGVDMNKAKTDAVQSESARAILPVVAKRNLAYQNKK
ncbi:MAG: hypothetical protein NXI04_15780 [Planctomycetaceae bacterium]|nr:hypothetical protein [Planctomycetaceae bacterium]